jgi:hypothetical protein
VTQVYNNWVLLQFTLIAKLSVVTGLARLEFLLYVIVAVDSKMTMTFNILHYNIDEHLQQQQQQQYRPNWMELVNGCKHIHKNASLVDTEF